MNSCARDRSGVTMQRGHLSDGCCRCIDYPCLIPGAIPCRCLCRSDYARCRIELSAARLTVLAAAHALDKHGNKKARGQIAAAKVYAPNVVLRVIDAAIQVANANLAPSPCCMYLHGQANLDQICHPYGGVALVHTCKASCSCSSIAVKIFLVRSHLEIVCSACSDCFEHAVHMQ